MPGDYSFAPCYVPAEKKQDSSFWTSNIFGGRQGTLFLTITGAPAIERQLWRVEILSVAFLLYELQERKAERSADLR